MYILKLTQARRSIQSWKITYIAASDSTLMKIAQLETDSKLQPAESKDRGSQINHMIKCRTLCRALWNLQYSTLPRSSGRASFHASPWIYWAY